MVKHTARLVASYYLKNALYMLASHVEGLIGLKDPSPISSEAESLLTAQEATKPNSFLYFFKFNCCKHCF